MINPILPVQKSNFYPISTESLKKKINFDQIAGEVLQKAKARIFQEKSQSNNFQATNLIFMAENALKNRNPNAAINFANKAIDFFDTDKKSNPDFKVIKDPKKKENPDPKNSIDKPKKQATHMYKDVSNDPGVSFTYASSLTGAQSFLAVPAHEGQHVGRAVSKAILNGENIDVYVSYSVRYDPRTGEPYMAGGLTRIIRHPKIHHNYNPIGKHVDVYA